MKTLKYRSRGRDVFVLEELLDHLGYRISISSYFGKDTEEAVRSFQKTHGLVIDGIVGPKTWSKLIQVQNTLTLFNDKYLSEDDLIAFSEKYQLELAAVKAVNEVESSGKGFLLDGRPRILFEGHVFWKRLQVHGIDPELHESERSANVLYRKWTKTHYQGGKQEYDRLEKAAGLSDLPAFHLAAYESASYGAFQIMGYHYADLGYASVDQYVAHMYTHERAHLEAFGRYCEHHDLIRRIRSRNWEAFAKGYNGPGYKKNKYHLKLEEAYLKHRSS